MGTIEWGFFFIMLGFRIQGVDIFPDIVGYLLFAVALNRLRFYSGFFAKAFVYNIPMMLLSIFSVYQPPAQGGRIQYGQNGVPGIIISIVSVILNLLTVYNILMGIRELVASRQELFLAGEAERIWNQYFMLYIAMQVSIITIIIPFLAFVVIIAIIVAAIAILIKISGFINRCIDFLNKNPENTD